MEDIDSNPVKKYVCIICPNSCELTAKCSGGGDIEIEGNKCPRGEEYVKKEITCPERGVTSTVWVRNGNMPLVSVKTKGTVPKSLMGDVMGALGGLEVEAPVTVGDVLMENVLGRGIDIVATKNVPRK